MYDANRLLFVTGLRWVVESVNARLKRLRWFSQTIQNSLLLSVPGFLAIVAALNNCFHVPMVISSPDDDNIVRRMNCLHTQSNALHGRLIQDDLMRCGVWKTTDIDNLAEPFPVLSLDYIRSLTLSNKLFNQRLIICILRFISGVYQLKRARSYAEEHSGTTKLIDSDINFPIEECSEHGKESIVRSRFRSAHKSSSIYQTYVQHDSTQVMA